MKSKRVPITYPGIDEMPILYANQFLLQRQHDDFIFVLAQIAPPIIPGDTDSEREAELRKLRQLPANVLGRYLLTRRDAAALRDLLDKQLQLLDTETDDSETEAEAT